MSESVHFEQLYFTNYRDGQQFTGLSGGAAAVSDDMLYLSETWFSLARSGECAGVLYNEKLGRCVACYMADASEAGDTRVKIWVHAAVPDASGPDAYAACLSWPFDRFSRRVSFAGDLDAVIIPALQDTAGVMRQKYHLDEERLACLMKMVCGHLLKPDAGLIIGLSANDARLSDLYEEACRLMRFIDTLVPPKKKKCLGFAAGTSVRPGSVPICFVPADAGHPDLSAALSSMTLSEDSLADSAFRAMAGLYGRSPQTFMRRITAVFDEPCTDPAQLALSWYLMTVRSGEDIDLPQELLVRQINDAEAMARRDSRGLQLLCRMLSMIRTENAPPQFCRTVLDKYITTAAALPDRTCREYRESFEGVLRALRDFCGDSDTIVSDTTRYLGWMRETYPDYYRDFSDYMLDQCDNENDRRAALRLLAQAAPDEAQRVKKPETPVPRKKAQPETGQTKKTRSADAPKPPDLTTGLGLAGAGFLAGVLADQLISPHTGNPLMLAAGAVICFFCLGVKFFGPKRR